MPKPSRPDTIPGVEKVPFSDVFATPSVQHMLGSEGGASSLEGWGVETSGEKEG